jgi:hypothetical protein
MRACNKRDFEYKARGPASQQIPEAPSRRYVRRITLAAGILLLVAAGVVAGRWTLRGLPSPSYQRVTFRRGFIDNGRFANGGRTIAYSASWDGNPYQVYSTQAESPESRDLEIVNAHLLGVPPSSGGGIQVRVVLRAIALEQLKAGQTAPVVAGIVHLSPQAVRRIAHRYQQKGLEGALYERGGRGSKELLDASEKQRVIAMVCSQPPAGQARWTAIDCRGGSEECLRSQREWQFTA